MQLQNKISEIRKNVPFLKVAEKRSILNTVYERDGYSYDNIREFISETQNGCLIDFEKVPEEITNIIYNRVSYYMQKK